MTLLPNLQAHQAARLRARARSLPAELHRPAATLITRLTRTLTTSLLVGPAYGLINSLITADGGAQVLLGAMWTAVSLLIAEVMLFLARRNARHLDIPSSLLMCEKVITPAYQQPLLLLQVIGMYQINLLAQPGPIGARLINAALMTLSAVSFIHLLRLATPLNGLLRAAPPRPTTAQSTTAQPTTARHTPGAHA